MRNKHKLAIITINYNGLADTIDFLESIRRTERPKTLSVQVYVVDNASSDDSVDVLSRRYPEIRLIESSRNLGFAGGNNIGIKTAIQEKNDLLMLVNNDTLVAKDLIKKLLASPIMDLKTGVLGGLIYFAPGFEFHKRYTKKDRGKVIWYAGGKIDWDNIYATHRYVDKLDNGKLKKSEETDFVTGAFFITKTEILKNSGTFDEKYFMYLEDVELCTRIKNLGYKIIFDPNLKLWHKVAQSSAIGSPINDYFITRNRLLFASQYASLRTRFALFREAFKKLFIGTKAQKIAIKDFFLKNLHAGSLNRIKSI